MLNVTKRGDGPPVVLLHGLFGNGDNLAVIARALAEQWSVYSIDLPGHGYSPLIDDMSLHGMAEAIGASIADLGLEAPHLVGHSLGGKVAMQWVSLQPEACASLCVLDIAPVDYLVSHDHDDVFAGVAAVPLKQIASRADADAAMKTAITDAAIRQFILTNLRRRDAGYYWRIDFNALQANYPKFIAAPQLHQVFKRPCLAIKGEYSPYMLSAHEQAFKARFADWQFRMIQGVGHWLHAEKPDVVNSLIRRFLSQFR